MPCQSGILFFGQQWNLCVQRQELLKESRGAPRQNASGPSTCFLPDMSSSAAVKGQSPCLQKVLTDCCLLRELKGYPSKCMLRICSAPEKHKPCSGRGKDTGCNLPQASQTLTPEVGKAIVGPIVTECRFVHADVVVSDPLESTAAQSCALAQSSEDVVG